MPFLNEIGKGAMTIQDPFKTLKDLQKKNRKPHKSSAPKGAMTIQDPFKTLKDLQKKNRKRKNKKKKSKDSSKSKTTDTSSDKILPDEKPEGVSQEAWDMLKQNVDSGNIPSLKDSDIVLKSDTQKALEDAPFSPIKTIETSTGSKKSNKQYYDIKQKETSSESVKTNIVKEIDDLTKKELLEETKDTKRDLRMNYSDFQEARKNINPNEFYEYQGELVRGSEILVDFVSIDNQFQQAFKDIDSNINEIKKLPSDVVITETDEGYSFTIPDRSLDFTKGQFEQFKQDAEQKDMWDWWKPAYASGRKVGFGILSSFGALAKPVIDFSSEKLGVDSPTKDIHFVSLFDVPFEPLGWSPEGSSEYLKDPFFTAGQIGGEWLQGLGITKLIQGSVKVASSSTKWLLKTSSSVIDDVPEFGKVASKIKGSSIGKNFLKSDVGSEISQNLWDWGTKGYKPITDFGVSGSSSIFSRTSDDIFQTVRVDNISSIGMKTDDAITIGQQIDNVVSGGGKTYKKVWGGNKTFVSPEDFTKIQDDLAKTLQEETLIRFPRGTKDRFGKFHFTDTDILIKHKGKMKGIFKKKIITEDYTISSTLKDFAKETDDTLGLFAQREVSRMVTDEASWLTQLKKYTGKFKDVRSSYLMMGTRNIDDSVSVMINRADEWIDIEKTVRPNLPTRGTRTTKLDFFEQVAETKSFYKKGDYGWMQKPSVLRVETIDFSSNPMKGWAKLVSKTKDKWIAGEEIQNLFTWRGLKKFFKVDDATQGLMRAKSDVSDFITKSFGYDDLARKKRISAGIGTFKGKRVPVELDFTKIGVSAFAGIKGGQILKEPVFILDIGFDNIKKPSSDELSGIGSRRKTGEIKDVDIGMLPDFDVDTITKTKTEIDVSFINDTDTDTVTDVDIGRDFVNIQDNPQDFDVIQDVDTSLKGQLDQEIKVPLLPKIDSINVKTPDTQIPKPFKFKFPPPPLPFDGEKKKDKGFMVNVNLDEIGKFRESKVVNPLKEIKFKPVKGGIL